LNIDGSRIGNETISVHNAPTGSFAGGDADRGSDTSSYKTHTGRWPANIILDEYTAGLLDEQSGDSVSKPFIGDGKKHLSRSMSGGAKSFSGSTHNDSGGASRFFYVAKASKKDRNEGLRDLPDAVLTGRDEGQDAMQNAYKPRSKVTKNFHPTVKPTALMEYLVKLVTPPGGTVLDPFTGSGSTGKAALLNGFKFIGIELTADYLPIIEGRLKHAAETYANQATEEANKEQETLF
jgi:site-specific DNA-methyltransferase (adenine-specific)